MNSEDIKKPTGFEVYWKHWEDPYDTEDLKESLEQYDEDYSVSLDEDEETEYDSSEMSLFQRPIKSALTPFGILPITEESLASKHFNFWVGHTNFRIKKSLLNLIEQCDGVETVDVFTPYRFRIGIGMLFDGKTVKAKVRSCLLKAVKNVKS